MQKTTPCLWLDSQAEAAVNFYLPIFPKSKILRTVRFSEAGPGPAGSVITVSFEINGQKFLALNAGDAVARRA